MQGIYRSKLLLALAVGGILAPGIWGAPIGKGMSNAGAQASGEWASSARASAAAQKKAVNVRPGTKVSAALESALDVRTAKPGDRVVARVTKNVKQHGRVVIHKGDRLVGHVTQVRSSAMGRAGSSIGVVFNQLETAGGAAQLNAVIKSVFAGQGQGALAPEPMSAPEPVPIAGPAPAAGGRVGMLGGAVGAVGGVATTVGSSVGGVGSAAGGLGSTVGAASRTTLGGSGSAGTATPVNAIHLGTEAGVQSSSGVNSVLSTRHGDMRLNSGTQLQFQVAASGQAARH